MIINMYDKKLFCIRYIHSFIPLFSVDLLQDVEIVMFLKVQEKKRRYSCI